MAIFKDLPVDLLSPILSHINERRDWYSCTLVNKVFYDVATPYLYRALDSRTTRCHPSSTLLRRPYLAGFVYHITETGSTYRMLGRSPEISRNILAALVLCINLRSMTWIDDGHPKIDSTLLNVLDLIRDLPLRELTIRINSDPGQEVWSRLVTMTGLKKISLSCTKVPSQVLQDWFEVLGSDLTQLELNQCIDVEPTSLVQSISRLSRLQDLRLRGVRANVIPIILGFLPNLQSLDTGYYPMRSAGSVVQDCSPSRHLNGQIIRPMLRYITIRTDNVGSHTLWRWILDLLPHPGLETFRLCALSMSAEASVPSAFITDLTASHRPTLKHFIVGDCSLTLGDLRLLCSNAPCLETLECSLSSHDMACVWQTLTRAISLRKLKLQVRCEPVNSRFTVRHAANLMLHGPTSKLRWLVVNDVLYRGRWVPKSGEETSPLEFQVYEDALKGNWLV